MNIYNLLQAVEAYLAPFPNTINVTGILLTVLVAITIALVTAKPPTAQIKVSSSQLKTAPAQRQLAPPDFELDVKEMDLKKGIIKGFNFKSRSN